MARNFGYFAYNYSSRWCQDGFVSDTSIDKGKIVARWESIVGENGGQRELEDAKGQGELGVESN